MPDLTVTHLYFDYIIQNNLCQQIKKGIDS